MKSKVKGVARREGRCPGWVVRRWDPKLGREVYMRFFGDREHGGPQKSRAKAETLSRTRGNGAQKHYRRVTPFPGKKLPIGVSEVKRMDGTLRSIRAQLRHRGREWRKDFSVKTSRREAVKRATAYRRGLERQVFAS